MRGIPSLLPDLAVVHAGRDEPERLLSDLHSVHERMFACEPAGNQLGEVLRSRYVIQARYGRQASDELGELRLVGLLRQVVGGGDRLAEAAEGRGWDVRVAGSAREHERGSERAEARERLDVLERVVE